jgi:hypothetical protein
MRGLSALEAIANPAAFFGPNFHAGIPAQLREQVLLIINEQATNVREIFVSSLNNIKGIAPELQQQFLELTSQFKTQAGLENYLQSVTGMTKEGLESYLNTLKNLPDEFKDKYVELAKTPEGRQALTRLFNSAVPSDYGRILELGAGMSPRELQKFADSFTSLNPKDRDFLLKLSENGLLKGPISDILKEVGPGGLKGIIDLGNSIDPKQYSDFLNNIRDLNGTTMQQAITMLSDPELRTAGVNLINNISPGVLPSFLDLAKDVDPRKIGDTFRNLDEKTAKELDKLMSDPEARKKLIASIEQRTPLEVPGIINFAAGLSNDKYKEIWDTVKDDDKFIAMLKDEKKRNGVLGVFNELAPGQTPRVVEFFSKLPNEKYEKGWDALTDMDGALQKEFGKLVQDPKSRDRFLKNLESVPGVTVPTMIRNFSSVPNEDLKEMWKKMDKMDPSVEQDFNRIMGKPDTGSAFTRMSNSFGESFISQIDSAVKLSESSLTQLGAALEGVDRVPGTSSESFSRIIAEPSSRKQMESLVNSLTTQQVSGLVQNLGSISNQQFQRFSGVVQTLPPGVQQTVLGAASQVTGGASDVSKYIEQVGTTTFVKQATSMTPQQLAQEIKKTTPR